MKIKPSSPHSMTLGMTLCALPLAVHADFASDSKASVLMRNFYYNHDLRDSTAPAQSKIEEWAQGFILKAESGYTEGTVGLGLDMYAGLGIKLDSSPDRSGSALLPGAYNRAGGPRNADPRSVDQYSEATGALKIKLAKSELKVGGLFPKIPLVAAGDARLLPQFFEGAMLSVREFSSVDIDLGQMRAVNYREFSGSRKMQTGNYLSVESDRFNYLGGTWRISPSASVGVWQGELQDVYRQTLYTTTLNQPIGAWKLGAVANYLASSETGEELAGKLDSRMASTLLSANLGAQTLRVGLQYNAGDSALPFLHDTDLPALANAVQVLRFDRAQERSWQVRYDFDFAGIGMPGLVAMARYVHGDNFKINGQDSQEWERNIDLSYVIQSGNFKDLSLRLRNVELVGGATGRRDENRFIVSYPLSLF